ncbi:MAG: phosphoenolpyruvate--protein phosphotransferase [Succinatimonas sp.]|nr:phosphoenolpyruvate--protein phosphotransferase [Succinatimonas sp.]
MNNANLSEMQNLSLKGTPANRGIAFGHISFLQRFSSIHTKHTIIDVEAECNRFEKARLHAISQLGALYDVSLEKLGEQNAVLFQIHQMMLDDPDYVEAINNVIKNEQANAEYAVDIVARRFEQQFRAMDNDYMQGRATDVIDVSRRVNEILMMHAGKLKNNGIKYRDNGQTILATDDLAPSETVQLDQGKVTAIITSAGSTRSHTVIFARTMGIPTVVCIGDDLKESLEGKFAIVDGASGLIIINPDEKTIEKYVSLKRTVDAQQAHLEQFRGKKTVTRQGRQICLYANAGSLADLDLVKSSDAEGIGLFRSEYIFLQAHDYPTEDEQFEVYKELLSQMDGKRVIIRTLDIGADKTCEYFMLKHEENPAMGLRAIRLCLSNKVLFKTQLRALLRASMYGRLAIMVPMITTVEEVQECLKILSEVKKDLSAQGTPFKDDIEFGIMIETPAAALISDELAVLVDFFSIGTNDLTQFTLAADRQNSNIAKYLDPFHHAVLRLIETTINNGHAAGIWVGICGEGASNDKFLAKLIQLGIDEISVVPPNVLRLRARIATLG